MSAYGAIPTTLFLTREAAAMAGGARIVFTTVAVGDGNGAVPALSGAGVGLVHEVWRGAVNSVAVNGDNSSQLDINVSIPDGAGSFDIREVMVLDENGGQVIAGICNLVKPSSGVDGVGADYSFYISIIVANTSAVTVSAPSGGFATEAWVNAQLSAISLTPGPQGVMGPAPTINIGNVTEVAPTGAASAAVRALGGGVYALDLGLPQGAPGTPAVNPSLTAGNITALSYGSAPTAALRLISGNTYALDLGLPAGPAGPSGPQGTAANAACATFRNSRSPSDIVEDDSASGDYQTNPSSGTILGSFNVPAGYNNIHVDADAYISGGAAANANVYLSLWSNSNQGAGWQFMESQLVTKQAGLVATISRASVMLLNPAFSYSFKAVLWKDGPTGTATPASGTIIGLATH